MLHGNKCFKCGKGSTYYHPLRMISLGHWEHRECPKLFSPTTVIKEKDLTAAEKIQDLRDQGFKVKVGHLRRYENYTGYIQRHEAHSSAKILGRGGWTHVVITNPDNNLTGAGVAICSDRENFSRRIGLEIALGRALKDYNEQLRYRALKDFEDAPSS